MWKSRKVEIYCRFPHFHISRFPNLFASRNGDRRGRRELDVEVLALAERRGAAVACHHGGGACARADRAAGRGSLAAAEDRAEDRAADRGAADFLRARPGALVAQAQYLLGV